MWPAFSRLATESAKGISRLPARLTRATFPLTAAKHPMCSLHAGAAGIKPPAREVLPDDVVPRHYRVFLAPDLPKFTYSGNVEIDLDVRRPTNSVTVNILDLEIGAVSLNGEAPKSSSTDSEKQTITWEFHTEVSKPATLAVAFDGTLNDEMAGFYRSVHKDADGNEKIMATTQMESTDCRRAFPCFDEPALKATFDISIAAEPHLTVLSNSDVRATESVDGKTVTHFNTTPLMSSYLVAFIVGEMNYVESNSFRVPIRVYAEDGQEEKCRYAAELAAQTLEFFENTFGIEYPMPKCDMVGVHSFSSGAMENWGLITYRVVDLFYVEGENSAKTKTRVTEVIQHELAHQWFGNLVTMEWWDGLWLNEGFATWMSWYAANHFFPDWKVWETYMTEAYHKFMELDGLRNSHPVQVPIDRASQVPEIFDLISYLKGSCIIRMVSQYLGEEEFIKGISLYLQRHKYGNTTTDDLWQALSDHSGVDVKAFLDTWTTKTGYPTVGVNKSTSDGIEIEQHRYLNTGNVKPEDDEVVYPVWLPVLKAEGSIDSKPMLTERKGTVPINGDEFYKLNAGQNGLYRVKYPDAALHRLAVEGQKADSKLSVEDRMGIILDLSALAGLEVSGTQLLEVAQAWSKDSQPSVVNALRESMKKLQGRLFFANPELRELYRKFAISVLTPFTKTYGLDFPADENIRVTNARLEVLDELVLLDDERVVKHSLEQFRAHKFKINPNQMPGVFRAVARHGTKEEWRQLWEFYAAHAHGAQGLDALEGLANTLDMSLIAELHAKILSGEVREQEVFRIIKGLVESTPEALEATLKFVVAEWDTLRGMFSVFGSTMSRIVRLVFGRCSTPAQLATFDKVVHGRDLTGIERTVGQARDELQGSLNALNTDAAAMHAWLKQNS